MKKFILSAVLAVVSCSAFAQFNVGSSTSTRTDMFGNTVTTHRDSYGRTTGTSSTGRTDMFGIRCSVIPAKAINTECLNK